jgi:ectoine hydroxylase-related dioxygenase (phytanoyl-CoA dioxygenase family)
VKKVESQDVKQGSIKHKLGFLYAPKVMDDAIRAQVTPIPLKVGQALVFSLSLVHGQEVNNSSITRFQSDIRVVNSMAPIEWERTVHKDYYKELCTSVLTMQAKAYIKSNSK